MKDVLDKISSYNIFNYLLPGALFVYLASQVTAYDLRQTDIIFSLFVYYFIGLVISRVGSLLNEPVLVKAKLLKLADYNDYIAASKSDESMGVLLETANMYGTMSSMFLLLLLLVAFERLEASLTWLRTLTPYSFLVLLALLFLLAYRKQARYIVQGIASRDSDGH